MSCTVYKGYFNASVRECEQSYTYQNWDGSQRAIRVSKDDAKQLARSSHITVEDAACIIGKIREIYLEASTPDAHIRINREGRMNMLRNFAEIISYEGVKEVYEKLSQMKYMDIDDICAANDPLSVYQRI